MTNRHGRRRRQKRHKRLRAWRRNCEPCMQHIDLDFEAEREEARRRFRAALRTMLVEGTNPDFPGIDLLLDVRVPDGPFGYGPRA